MMRIALLLLILLMPVAAAQDPNGNDGAPASVLSFKWFKDRRSAEQVDTSAATPPAPAMIAANKNFEKQRRINDPAGVRDPNADTLDGRAAELERIVQESRNTKPPVDGFTYQIKIQNHSSRVIQALFWEYQFKETANAANVSRRQFVCFVKLKPEKSRDLEIFTLIAPVNVVSLQTLSKKSSREFDESVVINRVEYDDGSVWQRKDWNFEEVKMTAKPGADNKTPICRGL